MAEAMPNDASEVIRVVLSAELRDEFEDWRRRQRPRIPSLSEGIRQLMSRSLAAEQAAA